jgi:hypothetical protein
MLTAIYSTQWSHRFHIRIGLALTWIARTNFLNEIVQEAGVPQHFMMLALTQSTIVLRAIYTTPTCPEFFFQAAVIVLVRPAALLAFGSACPLDRSRLCTADEMSHTFSQRVLLMLATATIFYFYHLDLRRHFLLRRRGKACCCVEGPPADSPTPHLLSDEEADALSALVREERADISRRLRDLAAQPAARWHRTSRPLHRRSAAVFEAINDDTGELLVAKRVALPAAAAAARAAVARLRRAGALRHANLVRYLPPAMEGGGLAAGEAWVLMELCDGGSVEALCGLYGALRPAVVRR